MGAYETLLPNNEGNTMSYQTIQITCSIEIFDDIVGILEFDGYRFQAGESIDVEVMDFQQWQVLKNILIDFYSEHDIKMSMWIPTDADWLADYGLTV